MTTTGEFPIQLRRHSRAERMRLAKTLQRLTEEKYGDVLQAIAIYGSTARSEDHEFSDLEMMAIVLGTDLDASHEGIVDGLKYEVDIVTMDVAEREILWIDLDWPRRVGMYLQNSVLFDHANVFQQLRQLWQTVIEQDFRPFIRAVFIDDIYEQHGKFFNTVQHGTPEQVRLLAYHLFDKMIGFVGIMNKTNFGSAVGRGRDALALPINLTGFQQLGQMLEAGQTNDISRLNYAVRQQYTDILQYLTDQEIAFESTRPILE